MISKKKRYSLQWRLDNLAALITVGFVVSALLAAKGIKYPEEIGKRIPVNSGSVALACEKIDPNTASVPSMRRLYGIGPTKAYTIVAFREANGPLAFRSVQDLQKVKGIGPAMVERIAPFLSFASSHGNATEP